MAAVPHELPVIITANEDFYWVVLLFFRVRELEFGNMRRYAHVSRHRRLGQKVMGALEGGNDCVEIGPNPSQVQTD